MCFTLFAVLHNLIFAPLFKRNISRTFNFRALKIIILRSGSARKLDVHENLVN